jgi:hypothetical protein
MMNADGSMKKQKQVQTNEDLQNRMKAYGFSRDPRDAKK